MRIESCLTTLQGMFLIGVLLQSACGGGTNAASNAAATPSPGAAGMTLIGVPADINIGGSLSVVAQVIGSASTAVTWSVDNIVNGNTDVGTISGSGNSVTYTAPAVEGNHVLTATNTVDSTKSAVGELRIHRYSTISSVGITPTSWALNVGTQKQFAATVTGSGSYNSSVTWSASRGTISSSGLYTAPSSGGSDVVTAKSVQDTTKTATASINVTVPISITSVAVSPATAALNVGAQKQFAATLTGTGTYNPAVTWVAQRGTITSTGLYTAPSSAGSDVVTAKSVQDTTKTATASISVTVPASITSVTVNPTTLALNASAQNQFTATVTGTGTYNPAVTWVAQRGSISSTGLYTAPATSGSDVVTVSSVQDSAKTASSSITVLSVETVTVSPTSGALTVSTSMSLTANVTGTTNTAVTWTVDGVANGNSTVGVLTGTGNSRTYTAPAQAGSHSVKATSVQDTSKAATASITVNAPQVAPSAPVLSGPTELQVLAGPYAASMALNTGLTAQWSITGGTLVSTSNGSTVQFQAGSNNIMTLHGTVANSAGSATTDRWMVGLPFTPRSYPSDLKADLATYRASIASEVTTGDVNVYYATSYYLMGLAADAEATGDTALMDELVGYIGQMIALAKPVVRNGVTTMQWGPFDANGTPNQAYTFMSAEPLARTAAIIANKPEFKTRYATQAAQMVTFVDQSIFKYWFDKTTGVYAAPTSPWPAGQIPWLSTELGGWGSYTYWANQCTHLGLLATWMYQATKNSVYLDAATRVGKGFKSYLVATNGHWIWNQGKMGWDPDNLAGSPDTSHANREPMMMVSMYEAGIVFSAADVDMMAHTFVDVIWNQSETDPMFSNYIDGSNLAYRTATAPGSNGLIYHGWLALGRYSPSAQRVLALSDQIIRTRSPLNVSLSSNASSYGRMLFSGTLARNTTR